MTSASMNGGLTAAVEKRRTARQPHCQDGQGDEARPPRENSPARYPGAGDVAVRGRGRWPKDVVSLRVLFVVDSAGFPLIGT